MFQQQELKFPVEWHYKIIADKDNVVVLDEIIKVLRRNGFHDEMPEPGGESSGGKYLSWRVSLVFQDRETFHGLSAQLSALPGVKYVI